MCCRYYMPGDEQAEMMAEMIASLNRREGVKLSGEVAPSDVAPVLANDKKLCPRTFAMKWGYTTADGKLVINARSETAAVRPMFRDGMARRRCVVPAGGYFEWEKRRRDRIRYAFCAAGGQLSFLAGLYRFENGTPVFTILTRESTPEIAFIHERMPVLLPEGILRDWMDPKYSAEELLKHSVTDVDWGAAEP